MPKEIKPSTASQHCVVYKFACDLCDADYVGYAALHFHQCVAEWHGDKNLIKGQFYALKSATGNVTASFTKC